VGRTMRTMCKIGHQALSLYATISMYKPTDMLSISTNLGYTLMHLNHPCKFDPPLPPPRTHIYACTQKDRHTREHPHTFTHPHAHVPVARVPPVLGEMGEEEVGGVAEMGGVMVEVALLV